jgi:hypothetical protein
VSVGGEIGEVGGKTAQLRLQHLGWLFGSLEKLR